MKNTKLLIFMIIGLSLIFSACGSPAPATPYPAELSWEAAVELLPSGEIDWISQTHNLDVYFFMKNGQEIHTVEPSIDAIFREIDLCGDPCSEIALATE